MSKRKYAPWAPAPWDHAGQCAALADDYWALLCNADRIRVGETPILDRVVTREVDPLEGVTVERGWFIANPTHGRVNE